MYPNHAPPPYQMTLGLDTSFPPPPSFNHHFDSQRDSCFAGSSHNCGRTTTTTTASQKPNQDQLLRLDNNIQHQKHHHQHHHQQQQQPQHHKSFHQIPNSCQQQPQQQQHQQQQKCNGTPFLIGPTNPMYPNPFTPFKDHSPSGSSSGSNRSSTVSSNSSGYSGSCGQLPLHLKQHHRLSGQSIESGISTLSSQYGCTPVTSSRTSLDRNEATASPASHGGLRNSDPYQQGLKEAEALYSWLQEINQTDCYQLFLQSGYDKPTISRMTPEDLTAIGITIPSVRKKLTTEISKLQIPDGIPNYWPSSLKEWLNLLHLQKYHENLTKEGYQTLEEVLQITWEDLEEIGIKKLGHQKKIILAIDKLKKIHASKNLPQGPSDLFDFNSPSSASKGRKRSPVPCHKLIADQISAKNKSKEIATRKSPEIIHLNPTEIPAPEIVAIKVNRSWSAGQQEQERPVKYESFHGSPSRDFKSLLRETSPNSEVFQSLQNTPTRFFEPPPSPAPDSSLSSPVKMRPPQVAPKPCCTRSRRASGGATVGVSFEAEMLDGSVLKRQNSCQGSILTQFSPVGETYQPAEIFRHPLVYDGSARSTSSDKWKKSTPPAPPKRTNSIKSELNAITSYDAYQKIPANIGTESEATTDSNAKLPPLARGLSRNWPPQSKAAPTNQAQVSFRSTSCEKSSSDCNTLPFANENVGTIKQKNPSTSSDQSKRPPVKPKPKISSASTNDSPAKQNSENDSEANCDSVFDDIDTMFQGLAKELDEMLIG